MYDNDDSEPGLFDTMPAGCGFRADSGYDNRVAFQVPATSGRVVDALALRGKAGSTFT